ncbi:MAG: general secretion pathway protein GspB [Kangiellaceae bacterium]|nr:general secretion pathway protein GspB [Kangiellaceae bacterium]
MQSLKQPYPPEENDYHSQSDSHFDDEMLSDDWLLTRVKFWKTTALSLLSLLVLVLIAVYIYWPKMMTLPTEFLPSVAATETDSNSNASAILSKSSEAELSTPVKRAAERPINNDSKEQQIAKYQPKIVERSSEQQDRNGFSSQQSQANEQAAIPLSTQNKTPVSFESLNAQEKREFPELAINSYAVSSNPAKSFVVLNGAFYGEGETIAPHLKLVLIDDDGIVVNYINRLIRKKHEL